MKNNPVREQLAWPFRLLDDRWGLTWRIINRLKRMNLSRTRRYLSAHLRNIVYERPIFVFGVPRSGTSALFQVLSAHPELGSLGREGHDMWRRYHHPRQNQWRSDVIGSGEIRKGEREFISRYLYAHFDQRRFVEKTPESCLRIPYLLELFPDACFILIKRDPRATISSLLNGWRHPLGRFRSYFVPERLEIPDYNRPHQWCFALIEGWQKFRRATIPQIVAEQWRQCMRGAITGRQLVAPDRWNEVFLEDFVRDPLPSVRHLLERLQLSHDPAVLNRAAELTRSTVNSMNEKGPGDWRENEAEVLALLPDLDLEILESPTGADRIECRARM